MISLLPVLSAKIVPDEPPLISTGGISMNEKDMEKVQDYFEAALAVPEQRRRAFLSELCGDDSHLYDEVIALLKADSQSKFWDSQGLFDLSKGRMQSCLQNGDEIETYTIVEQIGEGGMGVIYKAHDKKLQRHVALKFLPVSMCRDAQTRQRFLVEARAASQLDHPGICVIHDVSETPEGQLFISMPYYEGETLAKRISRGPLPHGEAVDIAIQVARGLACAHAHNIVHRDIKPANIMLTQTAGVKILDFGIAKVESAHLTQTGLSIGTPAYMSPEQLRGEPVDDRTDVWALGVVLFETLTGQQAFPARALPDVLHAILGDPGALYDGVTVDIPPSIRHVLEGAIERDPEQRFADMNTMLAALQNRDCTDTVSSGFTLDRKKRRAYQWNDDVLDRIASILLPMLGPIAPVLVQRHAKNAADMQQLCAMLSDSLPDQASRDLFKKEMVMHVRAFTSPPVPQTIRSDGSLAGIDLSITQLAEIEAALIEILGPITQTLIRRHAQSATSLPQLMDTLSQHLENDVERKTFLEKMAVLIDAES